MKNFISILVLMLLLSCNNDLIEPKNTPTAVFEEASKYIKENYAYLTLKQLNWTTIHNKHKAKIQDNMSEESLFAVCADLMLELKDGHCYLSSKQNSSYYDITQGYYAQPDVSSVLSFITDTKDLSTSNSEIVSGLISTNTSIGYVYFGGFGSIALDGPAWQSIMDNFKSKNVKKIILDIRNNGGGNPQLAQWLCGFFVKTPTVIGSMFQKSGKGQNDFIGPLTLTTQPRQPYLGDVPVILLTNRRSFSAASYLSGMMQALPNVTQMGQITGGGGGGVRPFELPNGWVLGVTANYFLDVQGNHIEEGVSPDVKIENTPQDFAAKKDRMLEAAIAF